MLGRAAAELRIEAVRAAALRVIHCRLESLFRDIIPDPTPLADLVRLRASVPAARLQFSSQVLTDQESLPGDTEQYWVAPDLRLRVEFLPLWVRVWPERWKSK